MHQRRLSRDHPNEQITATVNDRAADNADQIRDLIAHWAGAVRAGDLNGGGAHHSKDIVVFDVGSPRVEADG